MAPAADPKTDPLLTALPPQYVPVPQQPYQAGFGVRVGSVLPGVVGHRDLCIVRQGLAVLIGDVEHGIAHRDENIGADIVKFHFRYAGESAIGPEGGAAEPVRPMTFGVLIQPAGLKKIEYVPAAQHEQSVALLCAPQFLLDVLDGSAMPLPTPLRNVLSGAAADYYSLTARMRPEMVGAVRALVESPYSGKMRQVHIEAKALDLVCQAVQALAELTGTGEERPALRRRDLQRVTEICEVLERDLTTAPTIPELARRFGWNETQLMKSFRQAVGMTVHDYQHRARMERAFELLTTTDQSIAQIAFDVGYDYASNFTTAFRRFFELTPKQVRAGVAGRG